MSVDKVGTSGRKIGVRKTQRVIDYPCLIDEQPCELVALFAPYLAQCSPRQAEQLSSWLDMVRECMPCESCRGAELAAANLNHVRLGRHERNILLHAPPPGAAQGAILDPQLRTHAERETYLRAVRKLNRAGLSRVGTRYVRLETTGRRSDGSAVSRVYAHRTLWLTPLGVQIVARYRKELESGRPVRWAKHVSEALSAVRQSPEQLLWLFENNLQALWRRLNGDEESPDRAEAIQLRSIIEVLLEALRAATSRS